jgi:chorismate dehydratase
LRKISEVNSALTKVDLRRIGSVPYLNARPLIFGLEEKIQLEVPGVLAGKLRMGEVDAALVPIAEYLQHPRYKIVPGIAIGSNGPTHSVYLAHKIPLENLQNILLDKASKASNLLLKVVLSEFFHLKIKYLSSGTADEARLIIGDPALAQREAILAKGYQLLDLGEVWKNKTGLPFVFAFWAVQENKETGGYVDLLSTAKREGLSHLEEIIQNQHIVSPEIARNYFKENMKYNLGPQEIQGIEKFQNLCFQHGLIPRCVELKFAS